jgi:aminoglycoside/choline kinase family phosphotransferase/choline kinase
MKALILAAGLGTRLRPYTDHTPKPLFTVSNRTLLDITIAKLIKAGCSAVIINTHHLHKQIEAFVAGQTYGVPVHTRHEPRILGTGGAIKNVSDFWDDQPFMVVNADIVSEIDFKQIYHFHCRHSHPATLVLTDNEEFNSVGCNNDGFVTGFFQDPSDANQHASSALTFTGIQVLDPVMLDYIPDRMPASSIDAYSRMIAEGKKIKAYVLENAYWSDVGTPERYRAAVYETMAPRVFQRVFPDQPSATPRRHQIKGDGSDRRWFRLELNQKTIILADHGIKEDNRVDAVDAFFNIGRHLFDKGIAVPQIYDGDTLSGYVFVEDLGTLDLQTAVHRAGASQKVVPLYQAVIRELIRFSQQGARELHPAWCYQTPRYDKALILEKECRYFVDAFLNTYLGLDYQFADFKTEFELLAESALQHAVFGLMHRDFQSRNIMIRDNRPVLIDFQGARMGPLQYDLASLLIDPYVDLAPDIRSRLLQYCLEQLAGHMVVETAEFRRCFQYCCLTRNLQILGAFGYLTRVKGKPNFEPYIPTAVRTLSDSLKQKEHENLPLLGDVMDSIESRLTGIEKRKD